MKFFHHGLRRCIPGRGLLSTGVIVFPMMGILFGTVIATCHSYDHSQLDSFYLLSTVISTCLVMSSLRCQRKGHLGGMDSICPTTDFSRQQGRTLPSREGSLVYGRMRPRLTLPLFGIPFFQTCPYWPSKFHACHILKRFTVTFFGRF